MEAQGELEGAGGETAAEDEGVGGDAGIAVLLAGDRVARDGAVLGGPDAERVPGGPAVLLAGGGRELDADAGLDPGARRGEGVPGGDQLGVGGGGLLGAGRLGGVN